MNQYNLVHILSFTILPIGLYFALYFILKNKSEKSQKHLLIGICCFDILLYAIYKIYQAFIYDGYNFVLIYNLPLHFCNINLVLLPLAIITENKTLMAYQVYFGTLLAFFALTAIDPSFRGKPFFEFSCLVYYYYHSMLTIIPFILIKIKLFKPSLKNLWHPIVLMIVLTALVHILNIVLRSTGIGPNANYFYTFGLVGDPFTEIFKSIIPYNFFYLIPILLIIFIPYILLILLLYRIFTRIRK